MPVMDVLRSARADQAGLRRGFWCRSSFLPADRNRRGWCKCLEAGVDDFRGTQALQPGDSAGQDSRHSTACRDSIRTLQQATRSDFLQHQRLLQGTAVGENHLDRVAHAGVWRADNLRYLQVSLLRCSTAEIFW